MKRLLLIPLILLLGGCTVETASLRVNGSQLAVTLERSKPYFWSSGWELMLVMRNDPDCQRRHVLKPVGGEVVKVDVHSPTPGALIFHQGKRWYVGSLKSCNLQTYTEPPEAPGDLVGSFQVKGGEFRFVDDPEFLAKTRTSGAVESGEK
jgi:hypothetical protein